MHTEKDIKNTTKIRTSPEEKNKGLSEEEAKTQIFLIKQWLAANRVLTRKKLGLNPISFSTLLTLLPFALGFVQFLTSKPTSLVKTESFFQKTLPLFANFHPTYNYETLQYIVKSDTDLTAPDRTFLLGQPQFVAELKNPSSNGKNAMEQNPPFFLESVSAQKFNGISCNFYRISSESLLSKNKTSTRLFDELPSYVQGLKDLDKENQPNNLFNIQKKEFTESVHAPTQASVKSQFNYPKLLFKPTISDETKLQLLDNSLVQKQESLKKNSLENYFSKNRYKNRLDFYNTVDKLNTEIQNIFIQQKISLFSTGVKQNTRLDSKNEFIESLNDLSLLDEDSVFLEEFLQKNPSIKKSVPMDTLLQLFEKQSLSEELPGFRLMSGYKYPDMTSANISWFYKQNQLFHSFFGRSSFSLQQVNPLSSTISSTQYQFTVKELPAVLIETKTRVVRNANLNKVFYKGPALVLDTEGAYDWKTSGENSLRSWFHEYVSPLNPFTQRQENFFGLSPKSYVKHKNQIFSGFRDKNLLHLRYNELLVLDQGFWGMVRNPLETTFSPFYSSFHIPDKTNNHVDRFIRGIEVDTSKTISENSVTSKSFIPIIQLQQPYFGTSTKKGLAFSSYSPLFDLGITAKPDYTFFTESFNNKNYITSYKKTASVFSKPSFSLGNGVDNREPLTSHSWLVVSHLSFAVFTFQVLKSLSDNYGRELLAYLLDLVASTGFMDDSIKQEIEILTGQRGKGFRVFPKSDKDFSDIIGVKRFLPEISELLWFLRNSGRNLTFSKNLSRGILLTGPPGTGKTLLVRAIAGEAQVPVVVLSGSSLIEPGESSSTKLRMVFEEARQIAPCIVFIDELDTIGEKRSGIAHHPMGGGDTDLVDLLTSTSFEDSTHDLDDSTVFERMEVETQKLEQKEKLSKMSIVQRGEAMASASMLKTKKFALLSRLLVELDGIKGRDGVIVIAATNRPEVLDPALLRPGRLDKVLQVSLPDCEKRVEILQFYGKELGCNHDIPWNYLGERTAGFSGADLATLMNESAIKAILTKSHHTVETIEHGIDRLTTSENEKYTLLKTTRSFSEKVDLSDQQGSSISSSPVKSTTLSIDSKLFILRFAYHQAGKIVLSYFLEKHPKSVVASLWPRRPTMRSLQITTNSQHSFVEFTRLSEIHDRLVGSYAGKAAEFLFLQNFSSRQSYHLSTLGLEDLLVAQKLIYILLEKYCCYTRKNEILKNLTLGENENSHEFREAMKGKLDFYDDLIETTEDSRILMERQLEEEMSFEEKRAKKEPGPELDEQLYYEIPWWQQETSNALEFVEKNFQNWSRIYLYNPEQSERNVEWLHPDEFYHTTSGLKKVKRAFANVSHIYQRKNKQSYQNPRPIDGKVYPPQKVNLPWNDVANITRDYPVHSLVLQSFNKALVILNENRELLDRLVIELLYHEILRQPEIEMLVKGFQKTTSSPEKGTNSTDEVLRIKKEKQFEILESSWGSRSRKPLPRWIDFAEFSEETT